MCAPNGEQSQWLLIMTFTIGNDVAKDAHCEITMGNYVARDIHCYATMSYDISIHNDMDMNLFYYVLSALCLIVLFYYGLVWNKNKNKFMFDQSGLRTHLLFLCMAILLVLWTCEISLHKHMCSPQTDQRLVLGILHVPYKSTCVFFPF